ncbi:MAG: helix-turn-helix domain-containing protein [Actinocatenispora sp.]
MSKREAQARATRDTLLRAGRELFAAHGYAAVGTEAIVAHAGLTRGALYHHFRDKRDLFRAVHEQVEEQLTGRVAATVAGITDPVTLIRVGAGSYLDECQCPDVIQIALLDAPTVLGWPAWREVSERYGLELIATSLTLVIDAEAMPALPVRPLAHLLLGALVEAALLVANDPDPAAARRRVEPALLGLLDGLLTRHG